jgi:hypothetical protein
MLDRRRKIPFTLTIFALLTLLAVACKDKEVITQTDLKPFVNPPIPPLDPPAGTFTFQAEEGLELNLPSGTMINIPPNALVDATGSAVAGPVHLNYREFQDAISIYLAGIPMSYKDGHFTTAGSFEIRCFQNEEALQFANGKSAEVRLASMTAGDDYQFYYLNEEGEAWDSLGWAAAEVNEEKVNLKKAIKKKIPRTPFPLNRKYFAFNYQAVLDIAYPKHTYNTPESITRDLKTKCNQYGLGWEQAEVWKRIKFAGKDENAALMVWKNVYRKPFPKWVDGHYGKLKQLGKNRYQYHVTNYKDTTQQFSVVIDAVMPLSLLFAHPPQKWKRDYDKIMAEVRREEERLASLAEVYRTFKVSEFGIYNWDKLMKEQSLLLAGAFDWNMPINDTLSELTVICITPDNKGIINFPKAAWEQMAVPLEKNARMFCVLPGNKIGLYNAAAYNKIPFKEMEGKLNPAWTFDMEPVKLEPFTEAGFRRIVGVGPRS